MAKKCVHKSGAKKGKIKSGWRIKSGKCIKAKGATHKNGRRHVKGKTVKYEFGPKGACFRVLSSGRRLFAKGSKCGSAFARSHHPRARRGKTWPPSV